MTAANEANQEAYVGFFHEKERFVKLLKQENELSELELLYNQWELNLSRVEEACEKLTDANVQLTKQISQIKNELSKLKI